MNDNNINFLAKERNPPNAPQLRPIEKFWKNLKEKVMAKNYNPSNIEQLKRKIRISLKKFDENDCQELFDNLPKTIRRADRHGILSVIN